VEIYKAIHRLPDHPLSAANYRSIGCQPCTRPVADGEADRAGRWAGLEKIECGIHLGGMDRALDRAPLRGTGQ
ncbi:MAG TPA: hypothetical protein VKN63_08385, partial [Afifellaceae bacterium]|nr:hypothetical protein [Afifellaceae bacterium]